MTEEEIIKTTKVFVKTILQGAEGGHDWWHIERVLKSTLIIARTEKVDLFVVTLAALLHDIADSKFNNGDENRGPVKATAFLRSIEVSESVIEQVENIIRHISFKGGNFSPRFYSAELAVVQDADRLDALGAIGIARAFNYGGFKNRAIYDPNVLPNLQMTKEEYKSSTAPTINHFHEKLLLLKDKMNTATGRLMAEERHLFMLSFLKQFYEECEGEK